MYACRIQLEIEKLCEYGSSTFSMSLVAMAFIAIDYGEPIDPVETTSINLKIAIDFAETSAVVGLEGRLPSPS